MRDYEKARRDSNFRKQEMNKMKEEFVKVAKTKHRINADEYKEWCQAMNSYNKSKGRWVYEHEDIREMQRLESKADKEI